MLFVSFIFSIFFFTTYLAEENEPEKEIYILCDEDGDPVTKIDVLREVQTGWHSYNSRHPHPMTSEDGTVYTCLPGRTNPRHEFP